jgi:hypothetical protein
VLREFENALVCGGDGEKTALQLRALEVSKLIARITTAFTRFTVGLSRNAGTS